MTECYACKAENVYTDGANVYDDAGAAYAEFCEPCRETLEKRHEVLKDNVCVFCAKSAKPIRCDGMEFIDEVDADDGRRYHVCDYCRGSVVTETKTRVMLL